MTMRNWKPLRSAAPEPAKDEDETEQSEPSSGRKGRTFPQLFKRPEKSDQEPMAHSHSWTQGASLTTRGASVVLLAALACGPAALLLRPHTSTQTTAQALATVSASDQQASASAGETGLEVVQAWLSATKDDHSQLDSLMGSSNGSLGDKTVKYSDLAVASVVKSETANVWTVTVSAFVPTDTTSGKTSDDSSATPTDTSTTSPATVRMAWQVPVQVVQGTSGLESSAVAWPAPTTLSQVTTSQQNQYGTTMSTDSTVGTAVQELLTAYVTGGDVSRLISPDTKLEAIPAGVYSAASLTSLTAEGWDTDWTDNPPEGRTVKVLATASLTSVDQAVSTSSWALTLKARAGRWEVSSIDGAPTSAEDTTVSSTSTPTPEGDQ